MAQVGLGPILGVGYGLNRLACAPERAGTAGLHIHRRIFVIIAACTVCSTRAVVSRENPWGPLCFYQETTNSPDVASFMPSGFDLSVLEAHKAEVVAVYAASLEPFTSLPVLASSASGPQPWSNALPLSRFVASPKWTALHYIQHWYVTEGPKDSKEVRPAAQDLWWRGGVEQRFGAAIAGKFIHIYRHQIPINGRIGENASGLIPIAICTLRNGAKLQLSPFRSLPLLSSPSFVAFLGYPTCCKFIVTMLVLVLVLLIINWCDYPENYLRPDVSRISTPDSSEKMFTRKEQN